MLIQSVLDGMQIGAVAMALVLTVAVIVAGLRFFFKRDDPDNYQSDRVRENERR